MFGTSNSLVHFPFWTDGISSISDMSCYCPGGSKRWQHSSRWSDKWLLPEFRVSTARGRPPFCAARSFLVLRFFVVAEFWNKDPFRLLRYRYALGLVSMARLKEIDYVLERARLKPLFSAIVSAEDVTKHKPDPECYRRALERLNVERQNDRLPGLPAKDCVAVEDAPPGIESARTAGMRTIGVTNTVHEAELRASGADVVTNSFADWTVDAVHHLFD